MTHGKQENSGVRDLFHTGRRRNSRRSTGTVGIPRHGYIRAASRKFGEQGYGNRKGNQGSGRRSGGSRFGSSLGRNFGIACRNRRSGDSRRWTTHRRRTYHGRI